MNRLTHRSTNQFWYVGAIRGLVRFSEVGLYLAKTFFYRWETPRASIRGIMRCLIPSLVVVEVFAILRGLGMRGRGGAIIVYTEIAKKLPFFFLDVQTAWFYVIKRMGEK